jgi:DNA (cytosine-5)-methyltransferase 1
LTPPQRLNRHRAAAIRWHSTDDNGDPFAAIVDAAIQDAQAKQTQKYQIPAGVFEPLIGGRGEEAPGDKISKLLEAAEQARKARSDTYSPPPPGVFEAVGRERRGDPFQNSRPSNDFIPAEWFVDPEALNYDPRGYRNEQTFFEPLELPTDPDQLKALPTGFHDMTEVEQQEELWIVQAEGRLGSEWKLPDPGKHEAYIHDYPPYSPSNVLGMLHRWRNRKWTPEQWRLARAIAGNRSLRLPVLTAQAFLRRHTLLARRRGVELKMEQYLGDTVEWKSRLTELEDRFGITEADIKQWLWILSPYNGDVKFQRFFSSKCRKPLFLLQVLLAKDKKIHEPATFLSLLQYMRENYVLADRPQDELNHPAYQGQGRAVSWWHYLVFLYRLVWHCREGWPAAMPLLARLTADYIGSMRLDSKARAMTGYQARSLVLNKALRYFSWPARVRPIDHMEHNWAAQRHLLRLAATTEPPLVIDQNGYRAVREVLIALSKSKGEAKNADRAAKTWPPYRRTVDGIDERRDPEDDLSRSAKAGLLVRAAGYNDDIVDRAISALGGSTFGQSPTIQTRSLSPQFVSGIKASENIYLEWAAQIKATRNAREAWMVFENPPEPNIRPDIRVYAEMFDKLYARPVTDSPVIRPGDAKEVFPVYDGNLSEFEIARLTPPSPEELYDHMLLQSNLKPSGLCLAILVRNAHSKTEALRYLSDSPYEPYIGALRVPVSSMDAESLQTLSGLPLRVFNAWIALLCRLHTRAPRQEGIIGETLDERKDGDEAGADANGEAEEERRPRPVSQGGSIQEAIELATLYQRYNPRAGNHDRRPWHTIMQALAGRKVLHSRLGAEHNALKTLMTFLRIFERTTATKGVDPVSFEALCVMIRKALKLTTFQRSEGGRMEVRPHIANTRVLETFILKAHRYMKKTFAAITAPVPEFLEDPEPEGSEYDSAVTPPEEEDDDAEEAADNLGVTPEMLRYNVIGRPVHKYMMALACCGDHEEMVRVMDWLLDGWDHEYIREEAKAAYHIDYHYTMRTIAYFAEMGAQLVDPAEVARLERRLDDMRWQKGCTWFWPKEGWQGDEPALPELETDRVMIERWGRLRKMVNIKSPDQEGPASLEELAPSLPVQFGEREEQAAT